MGEKIVLSTDKKSPISDKKNELRFTDNRQSNEILTDNRQVDSPIQTLILGEDFSQPGDFFSDHNVEKVISRYVRQKSYKPPISYITCKKFQTILIPDKNSVRK